MFSMLPRWMIVVWLLGVCISLSLLGGVIWLICHFAAKYW